MLAADHIPKLGLSVGQPVMVVKGNGRVPGRYRAFAAGTVYVEHYMQPAEPDGVWGVRTGIYNREELDDFYTISEDPSLPKPIAERLPPIADAGYEVE